MGFKSSSTIFIKPMLMVTFSSLLSPTFCFFLGRKVCPEIFSLHLLCIYSSRVFTLGLSWGTGLPKESVLREPEADVGYSVSLWQDLEPQSGGPTSDWLAWHFQQYWEVLLNFEEQWQQKLQYKRKANFNYKITSTYMYTKQKQDPFGIVTRGTCSSPPTCTCIPPPWG